MHVHVHTHTHAHICMHAHMYTCPNGANAISKRVAVGGYYNSESPSNMLCLLLLGCIV